MAGSVTGNSPTPSDPKAPVSVIQQKAEAVVYDMNGNPPPNQGGQTAPNPAIIQMIITVITSVLGALSGCTIPPTPAKMTAILNRPGPIHRLGLRRAVRQTVNNPAMQEPIFHSCLNVSSTLSQTDVQSMLTEIGHG